MEEVFPSHWRWGLGIGSHLLIKILNFSFEMACFGDPERYFCQEMLAGYSDYNTMFAGQADMRPRTGTRPHISAGKR